MTTSIPTKSPDLNRASGAGSAASFFGGDVCAAGAPKDFATMLSGEATGTAGSASANGESTTAASVLASGVVAPALAAAETEAAVPAPSRDAIEQAAALIASLWSVLQPATPVQTGLPTEAGANPASAESGDVKVTLQWGEQAPVVLTLPAGTEPPANLADQVGEQFAAILGEDAGYSADVPTTGEMPSAKPGSGFPVADTQTELTISLDVATAVGATVAVQPDAKAAKASARVDVAGTEKFAGKFRLPERASEVAHAATERNFLNAADEEVTEVNENGGIGVAKSDSTMPAFFATRQMTPERIESAAHSWMSDSVSTQPSAETTPTPEANAASLARRAVDTIQNVIETQHIRSDHMGVVSLNFKFGAEDLAVRVQLRNGEVHTQFRTDSADLRAALSDEWHALMVGQGGDTGSRLIEPVFAPSNSSLAQQHSGSGSSSQHFAQKQQQEAQAPFALPEVRTFRKGLSAATAAAVEVAPQIARSLPTSLHLTAFA